MKVAGDVPFSAQDSIVQTPDVLFEFVGKDNRVNAESKESRSKKVALLDAEKRVDGIVEMSFRYLDHLAIMAAGRNRKYDLQIPKKYLVCRS